MRRRDDTVYSGVQGDLRHLQGHLLAVRTVIDTGKDVQMHIQHVCKTSVYDVR